MRGCVLVFVLFACSGQAGKPAQSSTSANANANANAKGGAGADSPMPPNMDVAFGRLFAKDGLAKLSAYAIEINCFDGLRPEDTRGMSDGQEHSPEMSLTRDPSDKGFHSFVAWLGKIAKKPGSKVVYARAFDGAQHVGWAALCIRPPVVLAGGDFTTQNVPDKTVRLTPGALEKLKKLPQDVNVAFMLEDQTLLTTAPVSALLQATDPTITFKQPGS